MSKEIKPWAIGNLAPQFTLKDSNGKKVSLAKLEGQPVLLIFYPGDDTPGCTAQLCAIRDDFKKFGKLKVAVYGINHANAGLHNNFISKYGFQFPILIDADRSVSKKYGAIKYMFGRESIKRSVVIINKDGRIAWVKRGMPTDKEILEELGKIA